MLYQFFAPCISDQKSAKVALAAAAVAMTEAGPPEDLGVLLRCNYLKLQSRLPIKARVLSKQLFLHKKSCASAYIPLCPRVPIEVHLPTWVLGSAAPRRWGCPCKRERLCVGQPGQPPPPGGTQGAAHAKAGAGCGAAGNAPGPGACAGQRANPSRLEMDVLGHERGVSGREMDTSHQQCFQLAPVSLLPAAHCPQSGRSCPGTLLILKRCQFVFFLYLEGKL